MKTALITGASTGIGVVFARQLAQRQMELILVARSRDKLEQLAAELGEQYGVKVTVIVQDLTVARAGKLVYDTVNQKGINVDLLVNNAGFGGYGATAITRATEEYDGSTWTSNPTGLNTARKGLVGCGIQTAALAFGGTTGSFTGATKEYDGSTWTTSPGSLNTARRYLAGCGTQTAALAFGGTTGTNTAATEEWTGAGAAVTKTITVS